MGLGDVPRDARAGVAADFGAAWFPLEPRAPGMAAPLRRISFARFPRPARKVCELFPRRFTRRLIHTMKRNKRRLPLPQHEFGFTPDTFNLFAEVSLDGERIAREQAEAEQARLQRRQRRPRFFTNKKFTMTNSSQLHAGDVRRAMPASMPHCPFDLNPPPCRGALAEAAHHHAALRPARHHSNPRPSRSAFPHKSEIPNP